MLRQAVDGNKTLELVGEDRLEASDYEDSSEATTDDEDDDGEDGHSPPSLDEDMGWTNEDNGGVQTTCPLQGPQYHSSVTDHAANVHGQTGLPRDTSSSDREVDALAAALAGLNDLSLGTSDDYDVDGEDPLVDDAVYQAAAAAAAERNQVRDPESPDLQHDSHIGTRWLRDLVGDYTPGTRPTDPPEYRYETLTSGEKLSLVFYRRWLATGGTVEAYTEIGKAFDEIGHPFYP
ncbi:hypothetical protein A4X09_0g5662 [Tilletia walkeri]|uniref:Uncharacterized protein n=1 Tax=Tilletia walkeri TaxID=117179 RepID=A0A8X7N5B9_9BASI|nr:hypothetical protein A4X09_0g5662 [Tilletia walkeri]